MKRRTLKVIERKLKKELKEGRKGRERKRLEGRQWKGERGKKNGEGNKERERERRG